MIKKLSLAFFSAALAVNVANAANPAFDSSADPVYNDGWQTGDNGGTGFGAWTLSAPGATNATGGFFTNSSTLNGAAPSGGIDAGGDSFGIYANSGIIATATRTFTAGGVDGLSILGAGETFSLQLDNGFINNGSSVGFNLQNSAGATRFNFQFTGGATSYSYNIGDGNNIATGVPFTDDGLTVSFFQDLNNAFTITITPNGGSPTVFNGTLTTADISQVQMFNSNAGSGDTNNAYFNNPTVVPEPSSLSLLAGPAILGAWFFVRRRRA